MKNTMFLFAAALLFTISVRAQSTTDSIAAKYRLLPMPEALTLEKTFPAVGTYHLNGGAADAALVTITLDSVNKGIIWVDGLPEGAFKAYLKQSPAKYRILAQKTASGNQIPEGTLIVDSASNSLQIVLGKTYNELNPEEVFALNLAEAADATAANGATEIKVKTKAADKKSKAKLVFYTGVKQDTQTALQQAQHSREWQ